MILWLCDIAGKTEFSKRLIRVLGNGSLLSGIIRIDADDIRDMLPGYNGKNFHIFQSACSKGAEILFDYASRKKYHKVIDGTFASLKVAKKNIERVLKKKFKVIIVYKYLDPVVAWGFTQLREIEEGRRITKDIFIDSLFKAKDNVTIIKEIFGDKVEVWLMESDYSDKVKKIKFNIDKIDNHLTIKLLGRQQEGRTMTKTG